MPTGVDIDVFEQLVETVERFARERLIPAERRVEEEDAIPEEIVAEMKDMGLFGLSTPEEYGGIGVNVSQEARLIETLCYASLTFRSLIGTNVGIGSQGIVMDGTEEQKRRWLPGIASGDIIASFALTEPDTGSDAGGVRTSARRDGSDFVINGTKRFITNAVRAGVFTVFARTDPQKDGADGVSAFIVPADTPGITVARPDRKMGQRGTKTSDVIFENVRVPESAILGGRERLHQGFRTAMKVLDRGRIHVGAMAVGQSQRMLDIATDYALERKQFGKPIGNISWCRGCWPTVRRNFRQPAHLFARRPKHSTAKARQSSKHPARNISVPRLPGGSPIGRCRSMVARAIWRNTISSGSIATSACCAFMKEQAKSSSW